MAKAASHDDNAKTLATRKPARHFWRYALWPVSVWMSFAHFPKHDADDYVEQTSPIMATAIAFWILAAWFLTILFRGGLLVDFQALLFLLPIVYGIGLLLYLGREGRYRG